MLRRSILLTLLFLFSIFPCIAKLEAVKGKVEGGYNYWFYTPPEESSDSVGGKPLIIFLHGASLCGSNLDQVRRYGTISAIEKGREIDAFVIAPQNPGGSWKPEKIMKIVDYVSKHHDIDPNRLYVLGMSLGGYGTIDFTSVYHDRVAAAIAMCGGASRSNLEGLADVPLWIIHGTADRAVSVSQSDKVVEAVEKASDHRDGIDRLIYDRIPGMNHSQPARIFYNPDVYDWLLSHSLDTPGRPINPTPEISSAFLKGSYSGLNHSKGYKSPKKSSSSKKSKTKKRSGRKK